MNMSSFIFWIFFFLVDVWIPADGDPKVFAPTKRVFAPPGDVAVLPCLLSPEMDVTGFTVEWSKVDRQNRVDYIHIYRRRVQKATGATTTTLFLNRLDRGDISLAVSNVTLADSGTYRCAVPKLDSNATSASVELVVDHKDIYASTPAPPPTSRVNVSSEAPTETGADGPGLEPRSFASTGVVGSVLILVLIALAVAVVLHKRQWTSQKQTNKRQDESSVVC